MLADVPAASLSDDAPALRPPPTRPRSDGRPPGPPPDAADRVRRRPPGPAALAALGLPAVRPPAVPQHGGRPRGRRRAAAAGRARACRLSTAAWRSRPTRTRVRVRSTRGRDGPGRWPRAWPTWPVSAPRRPRSSTASTSATPSTPRSCGSSRSAIDGLAEACRALAFRSSGATSSLYNESGGADIDPTPGARRARLVDAVHAPPPGLAWAEGDAVVLLGARARAGRLVPARGIPLGHRAARPPHGHGARRRLRGARRRAVAWWPAWWPRRWPVRRSASGARARACTTSRAAAWPSPWPRWRPRLGIGLRARSARRPRPSSSPSCRHGSWWPPPTPTPCAPGRARPGARCRAGSGRWRPCVLGDLVDLLVEDVVDTYEGALPGALGDG